MGAERPDRRQQHVRSNDRGVHETTNGDLLGYHDILAADWTAMENFINIFEPFPFHIEPFLKASFVELMPLQKIALKYEIVALGVGEDVVLLIFEVVGDVVLVLQLIRPTTKSLD